jgi:hypothetical protein
MFRMSILAMLILSTCLYATPNPVYDVWDSNFKPVEGKLRAIYEDIEFCGVINKRNYVTSITLINVRCDNEYIVGRGRDFNDAFKNFYINAVSVKKFAPGGSLVPGLPQYKPARKPARKLLEDDRDGAKKLREILEKKKNGGIADPPGWIGPDKKR